MPVFMGLVVCKKTATLATSTSGLRVWGRGTNSRSYCRCHSERGHACEWHNTKLVRGRRLNQNIHACNEVTHSLTDLHRRPEHKRRDCNQGRH